MTGSAWCLVAAAMLAVAPAQAQRKGEIDPNFPSRPIRLIVPQAPGGSNDIFARYVGGQLGERLGKQVVVDNRPGAEGAIGTEIVARSTPDGYTMLMASTAFTMNTAERKLPYDSVKDFDWVGMMGRGAVAIVVTPSLPVNSIQDLVAMHKAKPGALTAASAGGFNHFVVALFTNLSGVNVPIALYKGGFPALIDIMGGQAQIGVPTLATGLPHIRSGKLKVLATGSAKRSPVLPDVPTAQEAGVAGYEAEIWWAFATPAGVPPKLLERLHAELAAILKRQDAEKRFAAEGGEVFVQSPAQMRALIPGDIAKWEKVARAANMQKQ